MLSDVSGSNGTQKYSESLYEWGAMRCGAEPQGCSELLCQFPKMGKNCVNLEVLLCFQAIFVGSGGCKNSESVNTDELAVFLPQIP